MELKHTMLDNILKISKENKIVYSDRDDKPK